MFQAPVTTVVPNIHGEYHTLVGWCEIVCNGDHAQRKSPKIRPLATVRHRNWHAWLCRRRHPASKVLLPFIQGFLIPKYFLTDTKYKTVIKLFW